MVHLRATTLSALRDHNQLLQSEAWASIKCAHRWSAHPYSVTYQQREYPLLVLSRRLFGPYTLAYIPLGPDKELVAVLEELLYALKPLLPKNVFSIRVDLPFGSAEPVGPFLPCTHSVQPEATVQLDLKAGYDAVAEGYRSRVKRALQRAEQEAVQIREYQGEAETWEDFIALYQATAQRQDFFARSPSYLKTLVRADGASLLLAYQEKVLLAAIIVLYGKREALYLAGASLPAPALSASALLQDHAIRTACERGCAIYDLYGVEKRTGGGEHLSNLTLFKTGFGGAYIERPATVEYLYKRGVGRLFRLAERARATLLRVQRGKRRAP